MKLALKLLALPLWAVFYALAFAAAGLAWVAANISGEPNPLDD